jgi:phosphoribosylformylglycinamidine synthase subunit PurS
MQAAAKAGVDRQETDVRCRAERATPPTNKFGGMSRLSVGIPFLPPAGCSRPADSTAEGTPMKAKVTVTLKSGILDPQGKAIEGALKSLGVDGIASVRQGKVFDIEIADGDPTAAEARLREAAEKLLANTVIENYDVKLIG